MRLLVLAVVILAFATVAFTDPQACVPPTSAIDDPGEAVAFPVGMKAVLWQMPGAGIYGVVDPSTASGITVTPLVGYPFWCKSYDMESIYGFDIWYVIMDGPFPAQPGKILVFDDLDGDLQPETWTEYTDTDGDGVAETATAFGSVGYIS